MQRYFVNPKFFSENKVTVIGEDVHHIIKVLRYNIGDKIICCNNEGRDVIAKIIDITSDRIECEIISTISENRESLTKIILAQALPKSDKMELIIQKGTEIGVAEFIPFVSDRTIVQIKDNKERKKIERWQKIAKESAEQAQRSFIPKVQSITTFNQLLKDYKNITILIAYEKETTITLSKALNKINNIKEIMLVIGPEGGFTEYEIEAAKEKGAIPISLGKRILRTETAGLVGTANILYHIEEQVDVSVDDKQKV